jgi:hypothetical protein
MVFNIGSFTYDDLSFWQKIISPYDINPIFGFLYNYLLGGKAATLYHDSEYKDVDDGVSLGLSIPGSFYGTWYSTIFGKPFSTGGGK